MYTVAWHDGMAFSGLLRLQRRGYYVSSMHRSSFVPRKCSFGRCRAWWRGGVAAPLCKWVSRRERTRAALSSAILRCCLFRTRVDTCGIMHETSSSSSFPLLLCAECMTAAELLHRWRFSKTSRIIWSVAAARLACLLLCPVSPVARRCCGHGGCRCHFFVYSIC